MGAKMNRRTLIYLLVSCVAIAATVIGLATALGANAPSGGDAPVPSSISPHLSAAASADFGVFAQPQASSEDEALADEVLKGLDVKLDPASVRLAQSTDDLQVRVAGDSQSVCIALRIPGKADAGGCAPEGHAATPATPMIVTTGYPPGEAGDRLAVSVLFPDGTGAVHLVSASGQASSVAIVNNTAAFIAAKGDELTWSGPEGQSYRSAIGV
jgi:hypothetical protein